MGMGVHARRVVAAMAALLAFVPAPALAQSDFLQQIGLSGLIDLRLALADGEQSWRHGDTGKLRFGGDDGDWTPHAAIGDAHILWQPVAGAWRVHVDARLQPGQDKPFGLNEAWLGWKPVPSGDTRVAARAGLFYPPVSLENDGPGWTTTRTITPSAINSWIGEEVKTAAGEARIETRIGDHTIALTGALFALNDTSATLLTFRGWALHDETTALGEEQPLPPLSPFAAGLQAPYTTPIYELDHRPGYYARLDWTLPARLSLNAFWYDNRGNRTALASDDLQWAWETHFLNLGARYDLGPRTQLLGQFLTGRTWMGYRVDDQPWFDVGFQSAYLLATRQIGRGSLTARIDWMRTQDHTLKSLDDNDEHGWALTAAYGRPLARWATMMVEALHVDSDRPGRIYAGMPPTQRQTQVQAALKCAF
jgi:hypothetical protein